MLACAWSGTLLGSQQRVTQRVHLSWLLTVHMGAICVQHWGDEQKICVLAWGCLPPATCAGTRCGTGRLGSGGITTGKNWILYIINHALSCICTETWDNPAKCRGACAMLSPTKLLCPPVLPPHAGSGVVRIDPLRFLAGCRTRRLNQA